jgi:hypothetical protein
MWDMKKRELEMVEEKLHNRLIEDEADLNSLDNIF